ncbi:MAG: type I polyketide synthase, partial [Tumebacillaceae bacterium]
MSNEETSYRSDEIAIVGLAGRFPGAKNVEQFWQNLRNGVESVSFFTDEELLAEGADPRLLADPNFVKAAAVLDDVDMFDAAFFGFNPREAEILDPQHRLFLELCHEALETAGYNPDTFPGLVSVYGGVGWNKYLVFNLLSNPSLVEAMGALPLGLSNQQDFFATRIAYKLNLKGPALSIQTACSTSLVALHVACQSLLNGECDMALAGGVTIALPQKQGYLFVEGSIASSDGHCRAFDARGDGAIAGSGGGAVLLKRMEDAIADGDVIHAVIKGSAINNDGSQKVGFSAPSVKGQAAAIAEAMAMADVEAEDIDYVETHGTATTLGDPIEIAALKQVYQAGTSKTGYCAIGSVKTNVGHLDTGAGITGLIKTVMALKNKEIPPSLHYENPNPQIDFENSPFFVNTKLREWKEKASSPRRAGVSSFGMGGTNVHVILEEAPEREETTTERPSQLVVLSAKTHTALETATDRLAAYLQEQPESNLADVAFTLQAGRRAFNHRRVLVARDVADALQALETRDPKRVLSNDNDR